MRIQTGKYILNSDAYSMWIDEEYKTKTGKVATKRVAGYCNSPMLLLRDFRDKRVTGSDARNMDDMLVVLKETLDEVEQLATAIVNNSFGLERRNSRGLES